MKENKKISYGNHVIYKNSIMSTVYKTISAGISFITAPLLLYCLGDEKYGVWASVLSLISWVYYFDLGIGNGLRNKLAKSLALDDFNSAQKYMGISYVLVSAISALIFVIACIGINVFNISDFLEINYFGEDINACLLFAVLFACINFVLALGNNILYALQKASLVNLFSVIGQLFYLILLIIYSVTGVNLLFYMAVGEGCCQLLKNVVETVYVFGKNPELRFSRSDIDRDYANGILSFGLQMFVVQIAALILNSTDNLVITKLFGAVAVTPYSFCYKFFGIIQSFYVALITPLLSAYTAAYARKDVAWICKTLKKNVILYIIFVAAIIVGTLIFKPFSLLWLHKELVFERGLIISMALYFIVLMFNHIFSALITGFGRIKETTIATVICAILNIPISVLLARNAGLGTIGVILGSVVCSLIGCWIGPLLSLKEIKKIKRGEN